MELVLNQTKLRQQLKYFRQQQGLSINEFAKKIGMSMRGWQAIERGENKVGLHHLKNISKAFSCNVILHINKCV